MTRLKILVVLSISLFIRKTLCDYGDKSDSLISSHISVVPEYCHYSYPTIKCFQYCNKGEIRSRIRKYDHDRYAQIWAEIHAININATDDEVEREFADCSSKCETDPVYWSCVEECKLTDPTSYDAANWTWKAPCFNDSRADLPCPEGQWDTPECLDCLYEPLKEALERTCEIAHFPDRLPDTLNLCNKLSDCNFQSWKNPITLAPSEYKTQMVDLIRTCIPTTQTININHTLKILRECVNDKIMLKQRECCHSIVTSAARALRGCNHDTNANKEKCDDICMSVLSPHLCIQKCIVFRDRSVQKCKEDVDKRFPILNLNKTLDLCNHCFNGTPESVSFKNEAECVGQSTSVASALECRNQTGNIHNGKHAVANCRVPDYLKEFGEMDRVQKLIKSAGKKINLEGTSWIGFHKVPMECDATSTPPLTCNQQLMIETTGDIASQLCNATPFRQLEFLACAIDKDWENITLKDMNDRDLTDFPAASSACTSGDTLLSLIKLSYEYEEESICKNKKYCNRNATLGPLEYSSIYHPVARLNGFTKFDKCLKTGNSPYCLPQNDAYLVQLADFSTCRWKVDFAKSENPYVLWAHYFNELVPLEVKTKLESPDTTKILQKTTYDGKVNFYAFPYFVILRSICDEGSYYGDDAYRFFMMGRSPIIILKYKKPTNRHQPSTYVHGYLDAALIKLRRHDDDDDGTIPQNPQSWNNDIEERSCHEKICYPAFAIPLIFLHVSNFKVIIDAQETFSRLSWTVYVSPYHARTVAGKGEIQIAARDVPAHSGMLFPVERADFATDTELAYNFECFVDKLSFPSLTPPTAYEKESNETCPELDHLVDDFFHKSISTNESINILFYPLDAEDVFRAQYTYGTAPVQPIAGFYDPRLLIIGDADMNYPEVVNWGGLLKELEDPKKNHNKEPLHSCVQTVFKHRGYEKPLYSHLDKTDPAYPINYYRMRYAPLRFVTAPDANNTKEFAETGIFHAIGLEDRLLLVTNKGLVSFYGHSNSTVVRDKAWTFDRDEIVNRCFKIVRVLPSAQPNIDVIVGITYDYKYPKNDSYEDVRQELWIGNFTKAGEKIQWVQLKSNPMDTIYLEERLSDQDKPRGALLPLPKWKDPTMHPGNQEANPTSLVEGVCFKAFRSQIKKYSDGVRLSDTPGWCDAIDATPVQRKENVIQVLVRMRAHYLEYRLPMYFYIVASHAFHSTGLDTVWTIDSIIPRFPCVNEHREAIRSVFTFDKEYFAKSENADVCYDVVTSPLENRIYLSGMTYSKSYSAHLFLYGSRLLQSSNFGQNFVFLRSFPRRLQNPEDFTTHPKGEYFSKQTHRIIRIAFDESGHYAFLTNKRELWLGSTSSIHQYLLRPSPVQSMLQLSVSMARNINDGIPFTVDFDSHNELYELVALVNEEGEICRVMKRPVNEWQMLGAQSVLDGLRSRSDKMVQLRATATDLVELKQSFHYDVARWTSYCPFVSPILAQNFSDINDRVQYMYFPHPDQHLSLGKPLIEESLMAFQVSTFSLIWRTFFNPHKQFYAGYFKDPFKLWMDVKKHEETIGMLQFFQGERPQDHGILVSNVSNRIRIRDKAVLKINSRNPGIQIEIRLRRRMDIREVESGLMEEYWLDLALVIELRLQFSIKNDYSVANKDYVADEINNIQLNVENANGSIIQINTEKNEFAHNSSVLFIIHMELKRIAELRQNLPGQDVLSVPVIYHLVGAFGKCIYNKATGVIGDRIATMVKVGCPASRDFVFDWNSTLRSIHLKGDRVDPNKKIPHGTGKYCYHNKFACFFAKSPVSLSFSVFDEAKQALYPYTGKYIMRVVGGGLDRESIRRYSQEEIEAFNFPGVSDVSLIWKEWNTHEHKKIEKQVKDNVIQDREGRAVKRDNREIVLNSGDYIVWACHTLSPCARINPTEFQVVYWFRILVTNRDVDQDTLCLFEKEFDIMLYGFRPAPEFQFLTTIGSCIMLMGILYLTFFCCRRNARVWRHTKSHVKNWYYITKDAIPKKLRMYELPLADEDEKKKIKKKKHASKRGSDGNFSPVYSGSSLEAGESHESPKDRSPKREHSSASSVESASTASNMILAGKMNANLKKQVKYDQILTKRLNSIVERNWQMRQNLLKKASLNQSRKDLEIEETFEKQFGRTASEESLFTPPLPKDKRGGIDSFI